MGDNYLFKHGLEYRWQLNLKQKDDQTKITLEQNTREPRLIQYIPDSGNLEVSVQLCFKNDSTDSVPMPSLIIGKASDFGWIKSFRAVEVTSWLLATAFALVSGMSSFYIGKPVFGTPENYVILFLWGAGVDQGKNFIFYFSQFSPPSC